MILFLKSLKNPTLRNWSWPGIMNPKNYNLFCCNPKFDRFIYIFGHFVYATPLICGWTLFLHEIYFDHRGFIEDVIKISMLYVIQNSYQIGHHILLKY